MSDLLKKYICRVPFRYLEIHVNGVFACCPEWLPTKISEVKDLKKAWDSDILKEIRESIIDGSYSYCSEEHCSALSQLSSNGIVDNNFFMTHREFSTMEFSHPKTIDYSFDRSCNLSCPSCRNNPIMADGDKLNEIDLIIDEIKNEYGETLETIYLSGTADPFASKSFRKLLTDFNKKDYPNVRSIQLHTNAILFTKDMWLKMESVHKLIKSIEISVDAASKDTYEIVRRGGNWNVLIENLKFISTLNINFVQVSMVVQDSNYMEMEDFYNLMMNIFNKKAKVSFKRISNWNTFTNEEFKNKEIFNETHPEFNLFLLQLNKIHNKYNSIHNFNDITLKHIPKIIKFI